MLVNFRFKNFRSYYHETIFSMVATPDKTHSSLNTFKVNCTRQDLKDGLIKSAFIYGPNAGGKSNVLKALAFMQNFILYFSPRNHGRFHRKDNEPFAFFTDAQQEDSLYEIEFIQNGKFYRYGFTLNGDNVTDEWLYTTNQRTIYIFKREGKQIKINGYTDKQISFINLKDDVLFLTTAESYNMNIIDLINDVLNWFQNLTIVFTNDENPLNIYDKEPTYQKKALDILKLADIGINNIELQETRIGDMTQEGHDAAMAFAHKKGHGQMLTTKSGFYDLDLLTEFDIYNNEHDCKRVNKKDVFLFGDYGFNSEGTVRLLGILGYIIDALEKGKVILIDEFDSSLHFLLADYIGKLFNSIDKNKYNAQLIVTVQNTSLMDNDIRRDQIYFASKDECGISSLVSLSEFKDVRPNALYSKKYLAGFYTKLPNFRRDFV